MFVVSVSQSVCHAAHLGFTAKTAEHIKLLFGVNTLVGQRNIVLDVGHDPPQRGGRKRPQNGPQRVKW